MEIKVIFAAKGQFSYEKHGDHQNSSIPGSCCRRFRHRGGDGALHEMLICVLGVGRAHAGLLLCTGALGPQLYPWGKPDHEEALHLAFIMPSGPFRVPYTK